ncbi:hypothetical protein SEA_ZOOMAN_57 [Microbacterium phage Zooman]|nr:hypothetical protein SEA_ZOOMAN_57 [Microbacterium phage Zooman]
MPIGPRYDHLYVGDVPPVPTMPFPPSYPPGFGVPQPNRPVWNPGEVKPPATPEQADWIEKFLLADMKDKTTMTVWMIWVTDGTDPSRTTWLEAAWDDDSISLNREGWDEAVKDAYSNHGGANVRITRTEVDFDKVRAAFEPVDV